MPYGKDDKVSYCFHCMEILDENDAVCPHCKRKTNSVRENVRTLPPGIVLENKYMVGEVIGEGGFGITYIGLDLNLHLKVAIKEYFPASFASRNINTGADYSIHVIRGEAGAYYQKGLEDYAREANRLAQFASLPGIVSVLNFFYGNNTAYMIMEFVDGITLKEYLRRSNEKLSWHKALDMLHPVVLSLIEVHKAGIIHRDISPDNIMISKNGEMVLIDFGAARKVDNNQKKTVVLKKGYAPLEQYQSDGNQGTWSDVYSFCATIYRIIGGVKAPDALSVAGGSVQIVSLKTLAKDIPDFLDRAVRLGMENEISARIQSMEELEGYLYKGKSIRNKVSRKKARIIVSAMAIVFLLAIAVWFVFKPKGSEGMKTEREKGILPETNEIKSDDNDAETNRENVSAAVAENESGISPEQEDVVNEEEAEIDAQYEALTDTEDLSYENIESGLAIIAVDYSVAEVVIPGEINGQPVKELRSMSPNATSVVIKNRVEKISSGTFQNCVYLESIYIPASVTVIEDDAFENCMLLSDITVSENNSNFYSEDGKLYSRDGTLIFG